MPRKKIPSACERCIRLDPPQNCEYLEYYQRAVQVIKDAEKEFSRKEVMFVEPHCGHWHPFWATAPKELWHDGGVEHG